jgi:transcriptional regulator with XRE-family HTH domain
MSQSDLAKLMDVSRSLISKKMSDQSAFTLRDVVLIADHFKVGIDWLLGCEPMEVK